MTESTIRGRPSGKLFLVLLSIAVVPAAACTLIHINAPDSFGLTWIHRTSASIANWFGPWAVLLVRLVNFPNAGIRCFDPFLAAVMTALLATILIGALWSRPRPARIACTVLFAPFAAAWFLVGLVQIADGLL